VQAVFGVTAELRCFASADRVVQVTVIVNNVIVGTELFRDSEYRTLHYVVDQNITPEDRAFVVLFHCDRPGSPAEFGTPSDTRELGVHIRSFGIRQLPTLTLDQRYPVGERAEVTSLFSDGWHGFEASGIWSREDGGRIIGIVDVKPVDTQVNVRMSLFGRVYGTLRTGPAVVDLVVQGQVCTSLVFDDDSPVFKQAVLPLVSMGDCKLLDVRLVRKGAISPKEAEECPDMRKLGLHISEFWLEPAALSTDDSPQL